MEPILLPRVSRDLYARTEKVSKLTDAALLQDSSHFCVIRPSQSLWEAVRLLCGTTYRHRHRRNLHRLCRVRRKHRQSRNLQASLHPRETRTRRARRPPTIIDKRRNCGYPRLNRSDERRVGTKGCQDCIHRNRGIQGSSPDRPPESIRAVRVRRQSSAAAGVP